MLDPVVMPLPLALAVVVALAAVMAALRARTEDPLTAPKQPTARRGAHRLGAVATPYRPRDWTTLTADTSPDTAENLATRLRETRQRAGSGMWAWSDSAWNGDTRELASVR